MKKWTATLLSLLFAGALLNTWAQRQPKSKNKYIPACESDEERCAKCKIYQLENKLLAGEITQEQYEQGKNEELDWITKHCTRDTSPPPPPDPCWGKRSIYSEANKEGRRSGDIKFKVCRNEATPDGECRSTDDCVSILDVQLYSDLGDSSRNQPFAVTFLSKENVAPDSYLPFLLPNNRMQEWCQVSPKAEKPSDEFRILLPSGMSDSTWMVYPGSKEFLPEVKAKWFDYYDPKKKNKFVISVLNDIATIFSNAPRTKIFNLSKKEPDELVLVLRGEYKSSPFLVATGYADGGYLGTYEPVKLDAGVKATREALRGLNLNRLDPRIEQMVSDWRNKKGTATITAMLPVEQTLKSSPISAIGSPSNSACVSDALLRDISSYVNKNLLVEKNGSYHVWTFDDKKKEVTWLKSLQFSPNCHLKLLAIADPDLRVVASAKDPGDINKLLFFYHRNPNVLYSWVWKGDEAPKQYELLSGSQQFALTGQSAESYVKALKSEASDAERQFFLDRADKPGSFTLLDVFSEEDIGSRILLYADEPPQIAKEKGNVMAAAVKRLSESNFTNSKLHFLITDAQNEALGWNAFRARYHQKGWMRAVFQRSLLREPFPQLECWLSFERMGVLKQLSTGQRKVAVYLPEPHRPAFGPAEMSCVVSTIDGDEIIYKPGGAPPIHLLFKNWLASKWDADTWRANPLGYFDRCNNPSL
ncbi:MAG: hypothetical protein KIS77_16900 [Saprospiraceae bacterium]|nr:hypothetical protein [Saprospiraceae bacterium]